MPGVGVAFDPTLDRADALSRAVRLFAGCVGAIDFDQHGVVNVRAERPLKRFQIGPVAICRDLNASSKA